MKSKTVPERQRIERRLQTLKTVLPLSGEYTKPLLEQRIKELEDVLKVMPQQG